MELTIRQMIGQKTILGFHGPDLPEDFEAFIREYQVGNVILFQRNVQSADQLYTLCQKIRRVILEATGFPPFIVIDQEGGLVSRIPPDAVNVPSAMALGATGNPENAFEAAKATKGKPFAIVMKTTKGKDVSFMENDADWHGKAPNDEQYETAMGELRAKLAELEAKA